jgi:hypothetical protein
MTLEQEAVTLKAELIERGHKEIMTTDEMREKYEVIGFGMGLCVVRRRSDGQRGSLDFTHMPRFYFDFQEG